MKKKWWHGKVAYQIYPKSFYDSNGDGIGDLQGIISKLDYLKNLGVDIIWLSPIFCSPLADQGYDISDYYNIDPRFGSMEDMDELIAEAKKREMYILMDLVVNHCSDEHEWFKKAIEDPDGKYGDYFYIRDSKEPLTNWRSYFGGNVWDKLPGYDDKYYMHVFHKKQPDLNWENPEVRQEVYKMVNWWLNKGLGGFRIDAIINIKKPDVFHDYPADREDGLCKIQNMIAEAKGVGIFLNELKEKTFAPHDAFSVGEVFDVKEEEIAEFISDEGYFSSMFDFSTTGVGFSQKGWYDREQVTPEAYITAIYKSQSIIGDKGFFSNIIENHDQPRGASHYLPEGQCTEQGKKMLALITLMSRGLPFIYQGQEIGMENMEFTSMDQIDDISTKDEYQVALEAGLSEEEAFARVIRCSRDNARTPMQWKDEQNAGFSEGTPWMIVNPKYHKINVEKQLAEQNSVLAFYKQLIALRKNAEYQDTIVYGDFIPQTKPEEEVMAYLRKDSKNTLFVAGNFTAEEKTIFLPSNMKKVLINNDTEIKIENNNLILNPFQAVVILM